MTGNEICNASVTAHSRAPYGLFPDSSRAVLNKNRTSTSVLLDFTVLFISVCLLTWSSILRQILYGKYWISPMSTAWSNTSEMVICGFVWNNTGNTSSVLYISFYCIIIIGHENSEPSLATECAAYENSISIWAWIWIFCCFRFKAFHLNEYMFQKNMEIHVTVLNTADSLTWVWYNTISQFDNHNCNLVGNKIDHSVVVGASPVGAAPTTSSFLTQHMASMGWA